MSPTATLRSSASSITSPFSVRDSHDAALPFHHEPAYLNLKRRLSRYQQLILLVPSPEVDVPTELTPQQRQVQAELWSPLPYHRTKWLHNIEGARSLLLQLERLAQNIKVQRTRQGVQKDLAEKRQLIKKLRHRIEEIGREVETIGKEARELPLPDVPGETVWHMLQKDKLVPQVQEMKNMDKTLQEGKPVEQVGEEINDSEQKVAEELFKSSGTIRRRGEQKTEALSAHNQGQSSGYSGIDASERALLDSSRTQEELTTSMISMAAQLKQQAKAFQFSLDQDKGLLNRALEGLDKNLSGMEAASKNMQFLKRMSEEQGFFGRLKLYAMIFGMWAIAILLVFAGPKLRF